MPLPQAVFRTSASRLIRPSLRPCRIPTTAPPLRLRVAFGTPAQCRHFASQQQNKRPTLASAWKDTKTEWYWIPAGLGIAVVGAVQLRKRSTAAAREHEELEPGTVRPMGSWQVHVMSTLPLKALSYYWGKFNEIPLPVFLRPAGFKLYSFIFGVNLDEVEQPLTEYRNLAEFFYRRLKPDARPIDERANAVVSPADGKILQFGEIRSTGQVEQVKGMTYSLDALLGTRQTPSDAAIAQAILSESIAPTTAARTGPGGDADKTTAVYSDNDKEFANVNGISYTLPDLLSGSPQEPTKKRSWFSRKTKDASTTPSSTVDDVTVAADLASGQISSWFTPGDAQQQKRLFFAVVYLAPGDYHRFHSPVPWVVERRRHFAGELYSVSPYLQNRLPGLFTLNERVVLLGRWKHGMYSMTMVGATNVGSIKINFDRELRTNTFVKLAEKEKKMKKEGMDFTEATYTGASALLGGQPLPKGAEVGGFNLGSTIVLVFEAPANDGKGEGKGGFRFIVKRGQTVKVGEAIGVLEE